MEIPLKVGLEDAAEQEQFIEEMHVALDEAMELRGNPGSEPIQMFDPNRSLLTGVAELAPEYRALPQPHFLRVQPGAITWFPAIPYSYKRLSQGTALCFAGNPQQVADENTGRIRVQACSDPVTSGVDNAEGQLGTIITVKAGQKTEIIFSWVADAKLTWQLNDPQDYVNITYAISWEVWSWDPSGGGRRVNRVNTNVTVGDTVVPRGSQWGLKGSRVIDLVTPGWSNMLSRAKIPPPQQDTSYCVLISAWCQANAGGGAVELDLRLTQPA